MDNFLANSPKVMSDCIDSPSIDLCSVDYLASLDYVLIGEALFVEQLLSTNNAKRINKPTQTIIIDKYQTADKLQKVVSTIDENISNIVLASEVGKYEIIASCKQTNHLKFWDLSPALSQNYPYYQEEEPQSDYLVLFCLNPIDQDRMWLTYISLWYLKLGIKLIYKHPLQQISAGLLRRSKGILLWNGTVSCFTLLKIYLHKLNLKYSFVECGFFPQNEHIYFDKKGINVDSSLANSDFNKLPANYMEVLKKQKQALFADIKAYSDHQAYIFVPLQLGHDSNIQLHSRFTKGMQEFIDYTAALYPNQTIVYKAHPRDTLQYKLPVGPRYWSKESSLSLIMSALKVHGINSTVLFEAALYGCDFIAEGDCLLSRYPKQSNQILAAIIHRQINIKSQKIDPSKLCQNTYIKLVKDG